jgi:hypothetical protein
MQAFFNVFNTMNNYVASVFCLLGDYFCALYAVANHCSISMTENIILFPYTYWEYTKDNPGLQLLLLPPPPIFARGDGGFINFVYIFGKVLKRTWLRHGRVRPTILSYPTLTNQHSTYHTLISV